MEDVDERFVGVGRNGNLMARNSVVVEDEETYEEEEEEDVENHGDDGIGIIRPPKACTTLRSSRSTNTTNNETKYPPIWIRNDGEPVL